MGIGKEHMDGISLDTALLFKYFRGLTTGGERKRVEDWMQISEENEKPYYRQPVFFIFLKQVNGFFPEILLRLTRRSKSV